MKNLSEILVSKSVIFCSANAANRAEQIRLAKRTLGKAKWEIVIAQLGVNPDDEKGWIESFRSVLPQASTLSYRVLQDLIWSWHHRFEKALLIIPDPILNQNPRRKNAVTPEKTIAKLMHNAFRESLDKQQKGHGDFRVLITTEQLIQASDINDEVYKHWEVRNGIGKLQNIPLAELFVVEVSGQLGRS